MTGVLVCLSPAVMAADGEDSFAKYLGGDPENLSVSLKILGLLTILSVAPAILLLTTAFPRIVIVLGFVRRALSTQEVPPNQVIVGLAMILTFMVMAPTWTKIKDDAVLPYINHEISDGEAIDITVAQMRAFMIPHIQKKDLALLLEISNPELLEGDGEGSTIAT